MSQQINLYNPLLLRQQKYFSLNTMAQAIGLILLGMLLFYGYARYQTAKLDKQAIETTKLNAATQTRLAQVSAELGPHAASKSLLDEVAQVEAQLKERQRILDLLQHGDLGNRRGFSEYFRAFSRQTSDGVWLTGFSVSGKGEVVISGRALKPEQVPAFISRLKREPALAGKTFATLEMRLPEPTANNKQPAHAFIEFKLGSTEAEQSK
jgi:type VI protein secretion system component VasK